MLKRNISARRSETRCFKLHLTICNLEGLLTADIPEKTNYPIRVLIKWPGSRKIYLPQRTRERSHTSNKNINLDGCISWNEGFDHEYTAKITNPRNSKSWNAKLEIQGYGLRSEDKASVLGKCRIDISKFAGEIEISETTTEVPVSCCIGDCLLDTRLTVKLKSVWFQPPRDNSVHPRSPTQLLPSLSSCIRYQQPTSNETEASNSESDKGTECGYKSLAATNLVVERHEEDKLVYNKEDKGEENQQYHATQKASLFRFLSWKHRKVSFKVPDHPRDAPLLNKENSAVGGDDIDNDRHSHLSLSQTKQDDVQRDSPPMGFIDSDRFEVGNWDRRKFTSRDKQLELVTDVFLASIDQRSEKASGESACSVIAAVIADWLHQNPGILPLRCQLDKLIKEGSSEWRNLCKVEAYRERFSDQHFDLDTVLEAQIRPLKVIREKSYVGFFELENMPDQLELLQGAMSFDSIWEQLQSSESKAVEEIYIVSWNDHFFVLKIEDDAIYMIDTLGERLCEGCDKAYILKFDRESKIYWTEAKGDQEKEVVKQESNGENEGDNTCQKVKVCEGKSSCKQFIKGFLAAIPIRELQAIIERGNIEEAPIHQILQIEFQYTTPCNNTLNQGDRAVINQTFEKGTERCISSLR